MSQLIGLDLGTQSLRALLCDARLQVEAVESLPTPTIRSASGAEYDPEALWQAVLTLLNRLKPRLRDLRGLAVASMGESMVLTGEEGEALARALAWFDPRTAPQAREVAEALGEDRLFALTGYPADPTLSLPKLLWHRAHQPQAMARARHLLPIGPYIAFRLCGVAAVDPSLAARTLCLNVHSRDWDPTILHRFGLTLPPIRASGTALGALRRDLGFGPAMVAVGAQDHIAGAFAAGITRPGLFFDSIGTSEALLMAAPGPLLRPEHRSFGFVQTTVSAGVPFCLLGSGLNTAGGAVEWIRNLFGVSRETFAAEAATPSAGVTFTPHLAGASVPPDPAATGAFQGLTATTSRGQLFRAVLEGLATEAARLAQSLFALTGAPDEIRVIGGGTRDPLLLRLKARAYGRPLTVFDQPEMTALGAALLAGQGAGLWPDPASGLACASPSSRLVAP